MSIIEGWHNQTRILFWEASLEFKLTRTSHYIFKLRTRSEAQNARKYGQYRDTDLFLVVKASVMKGREYD